MKKTVLQLTVITLVLLMYQNIFSQSIVNKEWELGFGLPDTIDIGATVIDNSENIYTTGNTIVQGQKANILTTRYDKDGNLIWEKTFNYQGASKDYGTCITIDNNGYIYVAGASFVNAAHLTDYTILKYDTSGTLIWDTNYNEGNFKIDVPTAITLDNSGNIYVTGVSAGNATNEDYLTIKLDNNGNVLWHSKYNYANLADRALGIVIDNQNNVIVTGYSYSSSNNCDITTIKYDGTNGTELTVVRDVQTGLGFDEPSQIKKDNSGNIIIAGYIANQTQGYNIKTVKYDNTLNTIWEQTYDGNGLNDKSKSMEMDLQGNIIVTGYTTNLNNTKDIVTIKYDNAGNQLWINTRPTVDQLGNCEAQKIKTDIMGNTYLLCEKIENGIRDILTIKYNDIGEKKWEKTYTATTNEVINDLKVSQDGEVYLTTKEDANYKTVKYATYDMPMEIVYDSLGNPLYVKDEIIVRFDSSVVKRNSVDKVGLQYGNASTFLKDTIINAMNTVLPSGFVDKEMFIKIFRKMTTADSLSITRSGDTISIPPFWAIFRMTISKDGLESEFIDSLNTLYPLIKYAELNIIISNTSTPNDEKYAQSQASLHPITIYPNAHINAESAWDIEKGKNSIRVGVYDGSGIDYTHEDFGDGTFNGSKISGGWDYVEDCNIQSSTDPVGDGHGTSCAGIIGALSNNSIGIAGIAGGDMSIANDGVSLYAMKFGTYIITYVEALAEGAINSPATNYGGRLHIMSNSISFSTGYSSTTRDVIKTAYDNSVIFIAARGNSGTNNKEYPACYYDDWVISVGASGTDGKYKEIGNGNPNDNSDYNFVSSYGQDVDLIAPGSNALVTTLGSNNDYVGFNKTSAACPHVAGVVSLMLTIPADYSGYDDNLKPEDVEYILQRYATDLETIGQYDEKSGWGRLNAGESLAKIKPPKYKIRHDETFGFIDPGDPPILTNQVLVLAENMCGIAAGTYIADKYEIVATITPQLNPNESIIGAWARNGNCTLLDQSNPVSPIPHQVLTSYDNNHATIKGYVYFIKSTFPLTTIINEWIPHTPYWFSTIKYSFHTYDPTAQSIDNIDNDILFAIYPNPSENYLNIEYKLDNNQNTRIEIYNNLGQIVYKKNKYNSKKGIFKINTKNFEKGLYIVKFLYENNIKTEKLIIN